MNSNGTHFFVLNTLSLWQEADRVENLQVTGEGVSLARTSGYAYTDTLMAGSLFPGSLARDGCGVFYILDELKKSILVFDVRNRYSRWLECLSFKDPGSIAVSDTDIYVVDEEKLYCLARLSGQIRWIGAIQAGARIAARGTHGLYILDTDRNKVFKMVWKGEKREQEIELKDRQGQEYTLAEPTDIASDRQGNFYILEGQNRSVLKFDPDGRLLLDIAIPFKEEVEFVTLAAESSDHIFLGFKGEGDEGACGIVQLSRAVKYDVVGTYISKAFDSTMAGCRWHRVVLQADIPANTRVLLSYYAGDDDSETAAAKHFSPIPLVNPVDTLLTGAEGRYIRFKIQLLSDEAGTSTPLVQSLKVTFPRTTYLPHLPETYQEDEEKREFLERFLSLFETFLSRSEEQIFAFTKYLDAAAAPEGFIPWLSSWLAIAYDENWPPEQKRRLIRLAPKLYKKRGTPAVLSRLIEMFYAETPIIAEPFQFRCSRDEDIKALMVKLFGDSPHRFTVLLPPRWNREVTAAQRHTLQRIIDTEKPAHTSGSLQVLEPWFYLDMHTYLGMNTVLTRPEFILEKSSVLGRDTVIYDTEQAGQVARKSRVQIDTHLT
jgi:phage tail-like protein